MNEMHDEQDSSVSQPAEAEAIVLLKKLLHQLAFLEKKVDTLISQSQEKSFRPFPRPFHRDSFHGKRDQGHFGKHRAEEDRGGFGGSKKHYRDDRSGDSQDRPYFKKNQDSGSHESWHKKKPFYHTRKHRG